MLDPQHDLKVSQTTIVSLNNGDIVDSRFVIEKEIGKGGMGVVYRAHDSLLNKTVALKVMQLRQTIDPQVAERFTLEARITTELSHPNVVTVRGFGIDEAGRPYLVMNYLNGVPLDEWIKNKSTRDYGQVLLDLATQIASGMTHAHGQRIIHRDLKASNIFITEENPGDYQPKILDFGIAKMLNEESGLTCTGQIVGTPHYMSPEQASGHQADERSDIYSFGCLIYEMFVGHPPFRGDNMMAVLSQHLHSVPLQSYVPAYIWPLVERCLAKDPKNRYQSFDQISADLADVRQGKTLKQNWLNRSPEHAKKASMQYAVLAGIAGIFAFLVIFALMVTLSQTHARSSRTPVSATTTTQIQTGVTNKGSGNLGEGRQFFGSSSPDDLQPGKIPPHEIRPLTDLGDAYREADSFDEASRRHFMNGEFDQAIMMLEFQTKTYKEGGRHYGDPDIETVYLAMAYMHLGECYVRKVQPELALESYKNSLRLYATVGAQHRTMYAQAVSGYIGLLNSMGKVDEAGKIQEEFQKTGLVP